MIAHVDPELFNDVYLPYAQSQNRYEVYYGGRGSGKSKFIAQKLVLRCLKNEYFKLIYCRKVADTIRESQFSLLKNTIKEFGLERFFRILEGIMRIECANGNLMIAKGLDDPEKVKSTDEPSHIWCEEITEFSEEDFSTLDKSMRTAKTQVQAIASFNPVSERHWVRHYFFSKDNPHKAKEDYGDDLLVLRTTYKDNHFIDQEAYYKTLLRGANGDANKIRVDVNGDWGILDNKNPWLITFDLNRHVSKEPLKLNPAYPVNLSFDFNINPMTCIAEQHTKYYGAGSFHYVLKEFEMHNTTVKEACKIIKAAFPHSVLTATGDATGRNRNAGYSSGNDNLWIQVQRALSLSPAQMLAPGSNPSHKNSRTLCNLVLQEHPNFKIDPRCERLIDECQTARPIETENQDKEDQLMKGAGNSEIGYNIFDCLRYSLHTHHHSMLNAKK